MDNADQGLHEVFVVTQTSGLGGPPCVLPLWCPISRMLYRCLVHEMDDKS